MTPRPARLGFLCALIALAPACAEKQRIVGVRGGIYNMPGAVSTLPIERPASTGQTAGSSAWANLQLRFEAENPDLVPDPINALRAHPTDDPTRTVLLLHSPRHLVLNLRDCIVMGQWELIQEQIISDFVKDELRAELRDPLDVLRLIARSRRSVVALLDTMPEGDLTPGLVLRPMGGNTFRLSAPGGGALDLKFRHLDMLIEDSQFRLLAIR